MNAELLFQVFADRYERRSLPITSKLPFGEWVERKVQAFRRLLSPRYAQHSIIPRLPTGRSRTQGSPGTAASRTGGNCEQKSALTSWAVGFTSLTSQAWCHTAKHTGGKRILVVLGKLNPKPLSVEARAKLDNVREYIRENVHRMDYSAYLTRGWRIATGAVESACKTLVNQRLCLGGMRWEEDGSDGVGATPPDACLQI